MFGKGQGTRLARTGHGLLSLHKDANLDDHAVSEQTADRDLTRTNAFIESTVAEANNVRLQLPDALDRIRE